MSVPVKARSVLALVAALGATDAPAQMSAFGYEGCAALSSADFAVDTLVRNATNPTVQEPLKMAFDRDAQGRVDVYFTQRFDGGSGAHVDAHEHARAARHRARSGVQNQRVDLSLHGAGHGQFDVARDALYGVREHARHGVGQGDPAVLRAVVVAAHGRGDPLRQACEPVGDGGRQRGQHGAHVVLRRPIGRIQRDRSL